VCLPDHQKSGGRRGAAQLPWMLCLLGSPETGEWGRPRAPPFVPLKAVLRGVVGDGGGARGGVGYGPARTLDAPWNPLAADRYVLIAVGEL
jgi:hypothetical protein